MPIEDKILLALKARRGLSMVSSGWDTYVSISDAVESLLEAKEEVSESLETIQEECEPDVFELILQGFCDDPEGK